MKTKDQILMEELLIERGKAKRKLAEICRRLKDINMALSIVISRRGKNEFNDGEKNFNSKF